MPAAQRFEPRAERSEKLFERPVDSDSSGHRMFD
jgi:hypothetical protein